MRTLVLFLFFLANVTGSFAQNFYEISWESDRPYTALVVYYDQALIDVRVKYVSDDGVYHLAKYECAGTYTYDDDGSEYFYFDGEDAEVVYSSEPVEIGYIADNFLFTNMSLNNEFEDLYTIDDEDLKQEDISDYLIKATFGALDPKVDFTKQYVFNFFDEHEPEYELFLALSNSYSETPNPEPTPAKDVTLHLIFAADTKDRSIGPSTAQDMDEVTNTFTKISRELGIDIQVYRLLDNEFSKEELQNRLDALQVGSNDILVYYYSGHGYNDVSRTSQFPTMALDGPDYGLEDVYNQIKAKNARLNLIIGDLCNSLPQTRTAVGEREVLPFKSGYLFDTEKLSKMFIESKGIILSTSSQKGEYSFCMNNSDGSLGGGHFTYAFIESMIMETSKVSSATGDWASVFNRAYEKASANTLGTVNQNGNKGQNGFGYVEIEK